MSRNSAGVYTLPLPPVVPGTLITADWANTTLADVAQALTDSLDREGRGGMNAPLRVSAGTALQPAYSFTGFTSTGMFADGPGTLDFSVTGTHIASMDTLGLRVGEPAFGGVSLIGGDAALSGAIGFFSPAGNVQGVIGFSSTDTAPFGEISYSALSHLFTGNLRTTADMTIGEAATGPIGFQIAPFRVVDGASYIDFISATGSPDYNLRILRNAGTNGSTDFRHVGSGPMNYISQGSGPHQFFVNELEQFSLTENQATNIGNPDASGLWRTIHWPQTVSEVAWSQASLVSGWFALNAGPSPGAIGTNTFEFSSGSAFRQRLDGAAAYPIHILTNKAVTAAQHVIGAVLFNAFRDVADPSYVAAMWAESTTPAGNVPVLRFGAVQNGGSSLPGLLSGGLLQLQYSGQLQLSGSAGSFGHMSTYSGSNNSTQPSYMARATLGDGETVWGYTITGQSGEPTTYRLALAATVSSIAPGYPQHIYKWFLNQYNEFNSTSAQVLGTTGQWQFAVATGIISSAHLKSNWALEAGGLVDGLAAIVDVGSFDITLGDASPAIAASPALLPGEHPDFPNGRPAIVARPARPALTLRQVGTTAEAIEAIMPAAVSDAAPGVKAIAYGNAALVAAIALAKRVKAIEAFIGI